MRRWLRRVVVCLGPKHQSDDVHFHGDIWCGIKPTCPGSKVLLRGRVQLLRVLDALDAGDDRYGPSGQVEELGDPAEPVRS
jgi:hypothetical protein